MNIASKLFLPVLILSIAFFAVNSSYAGEIDILVEKLVEKGILTHGEAQQVLTETKEEVRKNLAKGELDTLPKWVQNTKLNGDFRLRFENKDKTGSQDQNRARVRLRLGMNFKPNDQMDVGVRVASGSAEQTSTNQTFTDSFSSKNIYLDLAYLKYKPFPQYDLNLIGGKMKNPFYLAQKSDLIWDGDVNPEGGAIQFVHPLGGLKTFLNTGVFAMYEDSSSSDEPILVAFQGGLKGSLPNKKGAWALAAAYYDFQNIKGSDIDTISSSHKVHTNTYNKVGSAYNLVYDYNLVDLMSEVTLPWNLNLLGTELPVTLYGDFVNNVAANVQKDTAWLVGFNLGKAKKKGTWQFGYNYRKIEADAALGFLNDSDFHGGGTNAKGHKFSLKYALNDQSTLGVTYLKASQESGSKNNYDTFQADWETKF